MKKIVALLICFILTMSVCITASAAGSSTLNGNTSVIAGSNIEFTVNVSGCGDATSIAVAVTYGDNFELVSGTWLKSGSITKFDTATKKGALGGLSSPDVNGNLFKLVLKAKTASANAQSISVNVIAKNGSNEIMNVTPTKSVKINCASHSYGSYSKVDNTNHKHTCSTCGNVETKAHTWNGGTVTKTASCKETGIKTYTCTVTGCGATKIESIAKTNNHSYGAWSTITEAKCTTKGQQKRTCSICGGTETKDIAATGHSMGGWTTTTEAKCTTKGTQTRKCSKCTYSETRSIDALGHAFSSPSITKQPTCTETGTESGKCSRCGQTTTNTIKAKGHKFGAWAEKNAATCTAGGAEERKCSACDKLESRNTEALGHDFENPTIVKEPTLTTTGLKEGKCKRCGETTSEVIPCSVKDETTGTKIEVAEGVFQAGTEIKIEEIKIDTPVYETVKTALKDVTTKFVAYDISAVLNNAEVQPNGTVKLTFKIPEGFGKNLAIYFIADDGTTEKLETKVNDDGTISADTTHLNSYVLCDLDATADADTNTDTAANNTDDRPDGNNLLIYIIIGVAVLVIAGVVIAIVLIKKKKANNIDSEK